MGKAIDLSRTVYELSREIPDLVDIMKELGFESIVSPGMLTTAGRIMTIPKGAAMKGISMDKIKDAFAGKGYQVIEHN